MAHGFKRSKKYKTPVTQVSSFGARQSKSNGVVYQADTDGVVTAWGSSYSVGAYASGTNPPTDNLVGTYHFTGGTGFAGMSWFVPKGYYWQADSFASVTWVPIVYT